MATTAGASTRRDPFSPGLQKLAALSGAGFALFLVLTIVFGGDETPDSDAPASQWATFASENADDSRLATLFVGLAVYELIWFAAFVRNELARAEGDARGFSRISDVVFGGGIVGAIGFGAAIALTMGALRLGEQTPPETVRALSESSDALWALVSAGIAAHMIAAGLLIVRLRSVLPTWLGWVALVGGVLYLLQLLVLLSEDEDNLFGFAYPLGLLALLIWTIGASLTFFSRAGRGDARREPVVEPPATTA